MSALVRSWLLARPALDEVGGERERRAREPDQRDFLREFLEQQPDRVGDRLDLFGVQLGQRVHVLERPHRVRDDRAGARDDVEVDTRRP